MPEPIDHTHDPDEESEIADRNADKRRDAEALVKVIEEGNCGEL